VAAIALLPLLPSNLWADGIKIENDVARRTSRPVSNNERSPRQVGAISEITFVSRSNHCMERCLFAVTVHADGSFRYIDGPPDGQSAIVKGKLRQGQFARLAMAIQKSGFLTLGEHYPFRETVGAHRVVRQIEEVQDNLRKVVQCAGACNDPIAFHTAYLAIESVIPWDYIAFLLTQCCEPSALCGKNN
jgi:hypothetical protein